MKRCLLLLAVFLLYFSGCNAQAHLKGTSGINHIVVALDTKTITAIKNSKAFNEFAFFTEQTIQAENESWKGLYVIGQQTYIEIFPIGSTEAARKDKTAVAFGLDSSGDSKNVTNFLTKKQIAFNTEVKRRPVEGALIDWFHSISLESQEDPNLEQRSFTTWLMEYSHIYMGSSNKEPPESDADIISRERYLPDAYTKKKMRNITRVDIAAPPSDITFNLPIFEALNYALEHQNNVVTASNNEGVIALYPSDDVSKMGIVSIEFELNEAITDIQEYEIGQTKLILGPGNFARWEMFTPN